MDVVIVETLTTHSGHKIGVVTLNDPKSLNALSLTMCQAIAKQLKLWADDSKIVAVLLKGSGERAFCAGGNIRKLYDSMVTQSPQVPLRQPDPYAVVFFSQEYALYRQMSVYQKPIVLWGNGIIMGGGMGLMAMCSHRVVTDTTRFAMPEVTIGLYPDATGSWFLSRMPAKVGLFLGLTGVQCNAKDALFTGLAEYAVKHDAYDKVVKALVTADWHTGVTQQNNTAAVSLKDIASQALATIHHTEHLADSHVMTHFDTIQTAMNQGNMQAIDAALQQDNFTKVNGEPDSWLTQAIATYRHGCPVSKALTKAIFERVRGWSLEQVLYMELNISLHCVSYPDFREGVRALLVDKDKSPNWSRRLEDCDNAYIDSHFHTAFIDSEHPFEHWRKDGKNWA